jgi:hypothetical protein
MMCDVSALGMPLMMTALPGFLVLFAIKGCDGRLAKALLMGPISLS